MKAIIRYISRDPSILIYPILAWILFAIITTVLTTYPLLSGYLVKSPQVFLNWETWGSFLSYTYNSLTGGIINYLNTLLFGLWILVFIIYRRTYIEQGLQIKTAFKVPTPGGWGSVTAILGGGCIGCGLTFLTNIFGATLGAVLVSLPLQGAEIALIGTVILSVSIFRTTKQIAEFAPESVPVMIDNISSEDAITT